MLSGPDQSNELNILDGNDGKAHCLILLKLFGVIYYIIGVLRLFVAWITQSHTSKVQSCYTCFSVLKFKYYVSVIHYQNSINTA